MITIVRFLLIIPVIISLLAREYPTALAVFFIAGISDGVDGFLARRYNWTSRFGSIADPVADKLLVLSVYITLAYIGDIPMWLMVAVVGRDIILIVGAISYFFIIERQQFGATPVSKVNTFLQLMLVGTILFSATFSVISQQVINLFIVIVFITTIASLIEYFWVWGRRAWRFNRT